MAILLSGRELAREVRSELAQLIRGLPKRPVLGVVLVGSDPASHLYVKLKTEAADEVGIVVELRELPDSATTHDIMRRVEEFNRREDVNGILIQLPLPPQADAAQIIAAMDPGKDADGFHPANLAALGRNERGIVPGVSQGIMRLIREAGVPLKGKHALLMVNSQEFALPLEQLLADEGVVCERSHDAAEKKLRHADIVVSALGKPHSVPGNMLKDGAIAIDVGTTKVGSHVLGDIDPTGLTDRPVYLTPVPGGVGPMTVAMLLMNVYRLAARGAQTVY